MATDEPAASNPPPAADVFTPPNTDARAEEWRRLFEIARESDDAVVPPAVVGNPGHVRPDAGEEITWWRPGWHDAWRYVGWRWILLTPALALLVFFLIPLKWYNVGILVVGFKLTLFMAAVALTLAGYVVRRAARSRTEPFCIFCGYNLTALPDNYRCPECGRPYTWRLIAEYRRDPHWFIERYKALQKLPQAPAAFEAGPVRRPRRDGT